MITRPGEPDVGEYSEKSTTGMSGVRFTRSASAAPGAMGRRKALAPADALSSIITTRRIATRRVEARVAALPRLVGEKAHRRRPVDQRVERERLPVRLPGRVYARLPAGQRMRAIRQRQVYAHPLAVRFIDSQDHLQGGAGIMAAGNRLPAPLHRHEQVSHQHLVRRMLR